MGMMLTEPVSGPVTWTNTDLARDSSWRFALTPAMLDDLDAALRHVLARGLSVTQIERSDFPLLTLGPALDALREELKSGRGFTLIRGLPVGRYTEDELAAIYWGLGTYLGTAVSQNSKGDLLGHVRDEGATLSDVNARGYQTHESQGLHLDNCDVVGLLSLRSAKTGGVSQIVSSMSVYNTMLRRCPWYVGLLYEPFAIDMRGQERPGDSPVWHRPVYSYHGGKLSCGVNFTYMRSAQLKTGQRLSAVKDEALDAMEAIAKEMCYEMVLEPGDMQFLNNYVVLHDRTPFVDHAEPERRRHLLRLWLTVPNARPLAPDFRSSYADTLRSYGAVPRG